MGTWQGIGSQVLADHPDGILKCKWGCLGMGELRGCLVSRTHPHKQLWSSGGGPGQMRGLRPVRESLSPWSDSHYHAGISGLYGMFEPGRGSPDKEGLLSGLYCLRYLCKELSGGCVRIENNHAVIDEAKCIACGMCAVKCPRGIILDADGIFTVKA